MAFFRKWKTNYKHKKFTSDDALDGEDWGLGKPSVKQVLNVEDMKLDIDCIKAESDDHAHDEDEDGRPLFATYDIKYLGCTPIEVKRSEKVTSEAIKTVIANSKAGGRKNKSQKRVKLNVSHSGIEVLDHQTQDSLMQFSIYKISYCSVDAAHDHAFSFVGSERDPLSEQEKMSCHVFQCPKRKIAHEITLMVARCFENAYQNWRDTIVLNAKSPGAMNLSADNNNAAVSVDAVSKKVHKEQNGDIDVEVHHNQQRQTEEQSQQQQQQQRTSDNLLIDLAASDNEVRKYLQNSWVSFEEDGVHIAAY